MTADLDAATSAPTTPPAPQSHAQTQAQTQADTLRRAAPWIAGFAVLAFVGAGVSAAVLGGMKEDGEAGISTAPGESVQIALNPALPPPVVATTPGKLEVLPSYLAAAAPTPPEPIPRLTAEDRGQTAWIEPAPAPQPVADRCAAARTLAEDMVCGDPELAADDRRLNRAYRDALAAGIVPAAELRADQRDWLDIREQAARRSVGAVADIYRQRIAELEEVAR